MSVEIILQVIARSPGAAKLGFVIARSGSDEAIQGSACGSGLLRFARNDGEDTPGATLPV
jgi:hypothetical protein